MVIQTVVKEFTTYPGKCFRYIKAARGQSRHCEGRTTHTGLFTDRNGKEWTVDACAEHAEELGDLPWH